VRCARHAHPLDECFELCRGCGLYRRNICAGCRGAVSRNRTQLAVLGGVRAFVLGEFGIPAARVRDNCILRTGSRLRPDIHIHTDHSVLVIECDERQHKQRRYHRDRERQAALCRDILATGKTAVIVRFNPAPWPFSVHGERRVETHENRMAALFEVLRAHLTNDHPRVMPRCVVHYLYYDFE